jgi:hypothetical protein
MDQILWYHFTKIRKNWEIAYFVAEKCKKCPIFAAAIPLGA